MDENIKKHIEYLKDKQKQDQNKRLLMEAKAILISNIDNFEQHYRFANNKETNEINSFINALPAASPIRLDFEKITIEQQFEDIYKLRQYEEQNVWICCICGIKFLDSVLCSYPYENNYVLTRNYIDRDLW